MPLTDLMPILKDLPVQDKLKAIQFLALALSEDQDFETQSWLSSNLTDNLPEYEWGEQGIPEGEVVQYIPGVGLVVGESVG